MATEGDRINRMEDQFIDMRIAVSRLLESAVVYQHKFETSQRKFETMNDRFSVMITEIRDMRRQEYEDEMPGDSGSLK